MSRQARQNRARRIADRQADAAIAAAIAATAIRFGNWEANRADGLVTDADPWGRHY